MSERQFSSVKDNKEKQKTYTEVMTQYKRAVEGGFFGEAMMIDYAVMEDRLRSLLFHIGALKSRESFRVDNAYFIEQFTLNAKTDKNGSIYSEMSSISQKLNIMKKVVKYTIEHLENRYCLELWDTLGGEIEILWMQDELKIIENWKDPRNEIVHALLNKNTDEVNARYETICKEGKKLGEYLNTQVKKAKKNPKLRELMGC